LSRELVGEPIPQFGEGLIQACGKVRWSPRKPPDRGTQFRFRGGCLDGFGGLLDSSQLTVFLPCSLSQQPDPRESLKRNQQQESEGGPGSQPPDQPYSPFERVVLLIKQPGEHQQHGSHQGIHPQILESFPHPLKPRWLEQGDRPGRGNHLGKEHPQQGDAGPLQHCRGVPAALSASEFKVGHRQESLYQAA
jgi:hypothetical protein